jgi:pyruvate,water dikinase
MRVLIKPFGEIRIADVPLVGGKNASLGEMINSLGPSGISVPPGFATTSEAFWLFIDSNGLRERLSFLMNTLDRISFSNLSETGRQARTLIKKSHFPAQLTEEIREAYSEMNKDHNLDVAVRSSATAEDLPNASFAGQHDSFLNVRGYERLLEAVKDCFASLYTDRAIKYREDHGFDHSKIALSVGVQKMVRSDKACSGVMFTLEPESGFRDVIHISGVWGLGETIVQGTVSPDEYLVFKPTLRQQKNAIIQKKLGSKEKMMIYNSEGSESPTLVTETPESKKDDYVLTDVEIGLLANWAIKIEEHYNMPMDIEWAKDGDTNDIYIIQARPETVHSLRKTPAIEQYVLETKGKLLVSGHAVGTKVASGTARILHSPDEAVKLQPGEIIVTALTTPDWDPILKKSAAIVTDKGGRTSHASIVARELGVPAIVGTGNGTQTISDGQQITVACCEGEVGNIYEGQIPFRREELDLRDFQMPESTEAMFILSDPSSAFKLASYPNDGVGLLRVEFIIMHHVGIHPMALLDFEKLKSPDIRNKIQNITKNYSDKKQYFIDKLSEGIATIAAAFFPKNVIVRMSDFKTNEYSNLLGGTEFEPKEENPMIGFRGASRYYHPLYRRGFELECKAILKARQEMGLSNIKVMIPFCRTPEEGRKVVEVMEEAGLNRNTDTQLEIYVMAEIPSNVLQAEEFAEIFDGFSIGSNDLTQLTLGIDRDSSLIADLFDERNKSSKKMIETMIERAKKSGVKIGLCGQAPSDYPEFTRFLVEREIDSISFNPDSIIKGIENIRNAELKMLTPQ